jgi:hypothetical protein
VIGSSSNINKRSVESITPLLRHKSDAKAKRVMQVKHALQFSSLFNVDSLTQRKNRNHDEGSETVLSTIRSNSYNRFSEFPKSTL